jgi:hypothetical protein
MLTNQLHLVRENWAVLSRLLTKDVMVPIGSEGCIAEKAPALLLMGLVEGELLATSDLMRLGTAHSDRIAQLASGSFEPHGRIRARQLAGCAVNWDLC